MKVRTKLIIGFSAMLVLLWLFVAYAANNMGNLREDFLAVESDVIPNTIGIYEIEEAASEAYQQTMYYVLSDLPEAAESYMELITEMEQLSQEYLSQYSPTDSAEYAEAESLVAKTDVLVLSLINIFKLKEAGAERSELLELDRTTSLPALLDLEQSIHDIRPHGMSQLAEISEDYQQAHFTGLHWLLIGAGFITIIGIGAAYLTTRSVVRPLHALHKGTEMVARGDLGFKVGTKAGDEIGQLSRAFDRMTEGLANTMTSVDNLNKEITERKKIEKTLRESEEKYRNLVERANDGICIIQDRMIKYTNSRQAEMWGGDAEEILNTPFTDFLHPDDLPMIVDYYNRRLAGEPVPPVYEAALLRKDGSKIYTELNVGIINYLGKPAELVITRDLTERKKAEAALRESEEKFSKAFRSSPNGVIITSIKEGRFIDVNDSLLELTGYTREELIGNTADKLNSWADIKDREEVRRLLKKHGSVHNREYLFRKKSGEIRTFLFSAELIDIGGEPCIISVNVDITERKKAEEALKTNEERYRLLLDNSTALISRLQITPTKKADYVSPSCFRITGYKQEEFYKRPSLLYEMIHPEDRALSREHMTLSKKKEQKPITIRLVRQDGGVVWVDQIHEVVTNNRGEAVAMQIIMRDITERKQSEEQLKQAMANLEQSSAQLAATNKELEAFSYSVSHDLRSPLRSIDGFSQALLEDYTARLDTTGKDYLNRLRTASQKMGELIDGLLKLSRLTRGEMHQEEVDLSSLVEEITSRLHENEPKRRVEFSIKKGLVARGDPDLLRALFENLLGNAWKFTGKSKNAKIEFGTARNGHNTTYFIKDNGAGFDMTYADKLFGAFQRLHDASEFPGTGIGLATVLRIINRHGGSIRAEGAVNKGATFYFTLNGGAR